MRAEPSIGVPSLPNAPGTGLLAGDGSKGCLVELSFSGVDSIPLSLEVCLLIVHLLFLQLPSRRFPSAGLSCGAGGSVSVRRAALVPKLRPSAVCAPDAPHLLP